MQRGGLLGPPVGSGRDPKYGLAEFCLAVPKRQYRNSLRSRFALSRLMPVDIHVGRTSTLEADFSAPEKLNASPFIGI